ncbi:hypothetical protein FA15DRAFT_663940 [Coprinopsis marcescibilis]|uniref:F-box domain-containing protein n=1 Tax=Coprinopsis marcescibilis TaxID=230819 RepID=A0A5C3LBH3_COPMA|nr:hypothetical protein FA15DRAFT_663940 [Coprinopsis marcescibilis]
MERCPPEILLYIFELACDDDGSTGRALSLASTSVNHLSREYKLQSVAVAGIHKFLPFYNMLVSLPERFRRVRHLFISSMSQCAPSVDGSRKVSLTTDISYDETCSAYAQVMQLLSPTIKSCQVVAHFPRKATLLPYSCPILEELTLQGPFPALLYDCERPYLPKLRSLTLSSFTDHPSNIFEYISTQAPRLETLSLYPARPSRSMHGDLYVSLNIKPRCSRSSPPLECSDRTLLPPSVMKVFIQPGPQIDSDARKAHCLQNEQDLMKQNILFMQKHDRRKRVIYVRPQKALVNEEALTQWLNRKQVITEP